MSNQTPHHPQPDQQQLAESMSKISKKLLVLSGKGGVGKSTVATNIAFALADAGKKVGLLDVDVHGPSIPRLTGLAGQQTGASQGKIEPIAISENLKVMSVAFLLSDDNQAVIWRGPMKYSAISQMLADTDWGELDYLVIDAPPGTGDEPLSVAQLVGENASAVVVTTPQMLATGDVKRCISFCKLLNLSIAGIVENMAGLVCPHCNETINIFGNDGGKALAQHYDLELLGSIPLDPAICAGGDMGKTISEAKTQEVTAKAFEEIITKIQNS